MALRLYEIPPIVRLEFGKLRSDSKLRKHPQGIYLFLSMFTGYFDGNKVNMEDIARLLEIKPPSLWKVKGRVKDAMSIEWNRYDLTGLKAHYDDLKEISSEIAPPVAPLLIEGKNGVMNIVEQIRESPTKYIARNHKNILINGLDIMNHIINDKEGYWVNRKELTDHKGKKRFEREWFPGCYNSKEWMSLYATLMEKVRMYSKDWIELFGTMEESTILDELNNRKDVTEQTIDFLQEHAPELVPKYIRALSTGE